MSVRMPKALPGPVLQPMAPEATALSTQGPKQLADDIWLVAGWSVSTPLDANALLIGGKHPVLIDTGSKVGYPALKRNIEALGYKVSDISKVLATHAHWDHLSGMARLREESGAKLYVHPADKHAVETGDTWMTATGIYAGQSYTPMHVDKPLHDGQRIRAGKHWIEVLHTPGHTPGSVSFILHVGKQKLAVMGDTVRAAFNLHQSNLEDWERSLEKLIAQKPDLVLGGHTAEVLLDHGTERLKEALLEMRVPYKDVFFRPPGHKPKYSL